MQVSYRPIREAITLELAKLGFDGVSPALTQVEAPRPWGVSTNVCFMLGARAASARIEIESQGLDKKATKDLANRLSKQASEDLARDLAAALNARIPTNDMPFVRRVEAEGPYLNLYYDERDLASSILDIVLAMGESFGMGEPTGRRTMVEYAQPNTHKDFHVGHLRNASIGQAIANLLEFRGDEVYKATYLGDVGLHVAKAIWGAKQWRTNDQARLDGFFKDIPDPKGDKLAFWGGLYKEATRYLASLESEHKESPSTQADAGNDATASRWQVAMHQIRTWLHLWENGDAEARAVWEESREDCDLAFRRIFSELDVSFHPDCWFYESTVDDTRMGQDAAAELLARGVAKVDDSAEYRGSVYVDLAERTGIKRLGKMVIQRSDGTSLYQTKELALAKYKFDHFNIDESLYVVGSEQRLYFEQVFAILKLWGFPNADHCQHISYELVVLPEGKMSSREGTVVSYRELRDEAVRRAREITQQKGIAGDVDAVAKAIAIAAIKFTMLQVGGNQQIVFDFEQALSFDGRSAPYLQYAYARAGKLVEGFCPGCGDDPDYCAGHIRPPDELHPSEIFLARVLSQFPSVAWDAAQRYEPAALCTYLFAAANAFSAYYRDCRVLDAPAGTRDFRQGLVQAFRTIMATGFRLLALPLPEEM